jgi:ketosteroid isomerase-like protein
MNPPETAQSFYAAIDEERYDDLADLLAVEFVHQRPDRTFEGREPFVEFMRDDRPQTDTIHELDGIYVVENEDDPGRGDEVAVRGRLVDADDRLFGFVDVHTVENGSIARVRTYTD